MKNKRVPLLGAIICILIAIFLITTTSVSSYSTDIEEPKIEVNTIESEEIEPIQESEPTPVMAYNISSSDREMLARLIFLEGNLESLDCQKAIASVIINRWQSGYWGSYLSDVIYAPNQFTPARRIPYVTPTATNYEAVDHVLKYGVTVPTYVLYFRANYHHRWSGYCWYIKIDNTCFGYMAKDKKD